LKVVQIDRKAMRLHREGTKGGQNRGGRVGTGKKREGGRTGAQYF